MKNLLLIFLLAAISVGIGAMSMGLISKLVLFSEVNGQVVDRGKPVAGAIVRRYYNWHWTDAESTDQTVTDDEGRFNFKSATTHSITANLFPHQPVISQQLDIQMGGKTYQAWRLNKMDYDLNGELHGKAIHLICDIATEPKLEGDLYGISRVL